MIIEEKMIIRKKEILDIILLIIVYKYIYIIIYIFKYFYKYIYKNNNYIILILIQKLNCNNNIYNYCNYLFSSKNNKIIFYINI